MRLAFTFFLFFLWISASSQVPDTGRKAKRLSLSKYPKPAPPEKKSAYVVITSDKKATGADTWENEWTDYVEQQSRLIAEKVLLLDSNRITYKVMINFDTHEDGSVTNLEVDCSPANDFIIKECSKMAVSAPKRKSFYQKGKYVRMHVQQPVDIVVR